MNVDLIVYLAAMAILFLYTNWCRSSGYLWICFYVLIQWLLEEFIQQSVIVTSLVASLSLLINFEIVRRVWEDPFSKAKLTKLFWWVWEKLGILIKVLGFKPHVVIIDYKQTEQVKKAINLLNLKEWGELESYLKDLTANTRYHVIQNITDVKGRPAVFDLWLDECQDSAMSCTVSGYQLIHWAWEARGSGDASTVTEEGIELFYERLIWARALLERAIELDGRLPDPYVGLMTVAMGTGFDREELWNYFAKVLINCRDHYAAHSCMIQALSEKWGGEAGEMFNIANRVLCNTDRDNPLIGVVAEAHIEQWLYLEMCGLESEANIYFREQSVRDELQEAYEKIRQSTPDSEIYITALNNFAFCFYMAGLNTLAIEVFLKLKGSFIEHPWDYLSEPLLASFDTAYAIDHVIHKLGVVYGDLPDIVVTNKKPDVIKHGDDCSTYISDAADQEQRRIFKTPIIVPLSVGFVVFAYLGYPLSKMLVKEVGFLDTVKPISFELFLLCEFGLMAIILSGKKYLGAFLDKHPVIASKEAVEDLKPVARTNMYSALMAFFFLGFGSVLAVMTIFNDGWGKGITVMVLCNVAALMMAQYNSLEKKVKQIECIDDKLEEELNEIFDCWMNKAFPNF